MRALGLIALLLTLLSGCGESPSTAPRDVRKISVAFTAQPEAALIHVALRKGYFSEQGLEVDAQPHPFGRLALQAMLDGKVDIASVAETPFMHAVLNGEKLFAVATVATSNTNNAIIGRIDAGIVRPVDLRGKRIAFTPGTTSEFFADSLLSAHRVERSEVRLMPMSPEDILTALPAGTVDAAAVWNLTLAQLQRSLGDNGISFFDRDIYTVTFNVIAPQDYVRQNEETLRRFLRALIKAETFAAERPAEMRAIVAETLKIPPDLLDDIWPGFEFGVTLDRRLLIALEDETRWAILNQLTEARTMPNYLGYIHPDPLRAVRPDAVRIGR